MARGGANILAVVPARGGSKGIPRKNLARVLGASLIEHAARTIASLDWIDAAVVSTDDAEICNEAIRCGLDGPFLRPAELSVDTATSVDTWAHAWRFCEEHYQKRFDISILLEPTSPLRRPEDVEASVDMLLMGDWLAVATVSESPAHHIPEKTLLVEDGRIGFFVHDGAKFSRRQDVSRRYFYRNGVCYASKRSAVLDAGTIVERNCGAYVIKRPVVNIDEPLDLEWADFLLRRQDRDRQRSSSVQQ